MYSDGDLNDAVEAGILEADQVRAFREHIAARRGAPIADSEHVRLITGFNDIFVVVAGGMMLAAAVWLISRRPEHALHAAFVLTGLSWLLAEYFTRRKRMALPSIVFLLSFVSGAFWLGYELVETFWGSAVLEVETGKWHLLTASVAAALAAWGHWNRFRVPITVAAGVAALIGVALFGIAIIDTRFFFGYLHGLLLASGLAAFALAMRWDLSDVARETRNSDIAFWLHLLAAPLIVHPIFVNVLDMGLPGLWEQTVVAGIYVLLGFVALVVDRRVLLVSGLAYVVMAISGLAEAVGAVETDAGISVFVIGGLLLLLSVFWNDLRAPVMARLPSVWQVRLPSVGRR